MRGTLPKDLPGGRDFNQEFQPLSLGAGQIWRKRGPIDAVKILRVMIPGHNEYDGGCHGISVRFTALGKRGVSWQRKSWFIAGSEKTIHKWLRDDGYSLASQ